METAKNDVSRTALSYISEKIHQGDSGDAVHLGTFDGLDALAIQQTVGDDSYTTYIYLYEKELKELFIKDGVQARASAGKTILSISDFSMEELKNGLFSFTCTDENGESASTIVAVRGTATSKNEVNTQ